MIEAVHLWSVGVVALAGGLLGIVAACGPDVEPRGDCHRHLAEEWCREWFDFVGDCSTNTWPEDLRRSESAECEANEAWDWTDECGDLFWARLDCMSTEIPCDRWVAVSLDQDNSFCQAEQKRFFENCNYQEHRG